MVAVPTPRAVTCPVHESTVATFSRLDDQHNDLLVAFVGYAVADSEKVSPGVRGGADQFIKIEVTGTVPLFTVTRQSAVTPLPSVAMAVTVVVPTLRAVTSPVLAFTVAMFSLSENQVSVLLVAFDGYAVADRPNVSPGTSAGVDCWFIKIEVTQIAI